MNRAVPSDFSYMRSDNSGTPIPAEPADNVASENVCPIFNSILCHQRVISGGDFLCIVTPALRHFTAGAA